MNVRTSMLAVVFLVIVLALTQGTCAAQGKMIDPGSTPSTQKTESGDAKPQEMISLGQVWQVAECCGWSGTWTRRPGTNVFDAKWRHTNGTTAQDVITLRSWNTLSGAIVLTRQSVSGTYKATINSRTRKITGGTATWYPAGETWSAQY